MPDSDSRFELPNLSEGREPTELSQTLRIAAAVLEHEGRRALSGAVLGVGSALRRAAAALQRASDSLVAGSLVGSRSLSIAAVSPSVTAAAVAVIELEKLASFIRGRADHLRLYAAALRDHIRAEQTRHLRPPAPEFAQSGPAVLLPPELLREAIAFSQQRKEPLLTRLVSATRADATVDAADQNADGSHFTICTRDVDTGRVPRRWHLDWVSETLRNGIAPEQLGRTFGDAFAEALIDRASTDPDFTLDERQYAQAYEGPGTGSDEEIASWVGQVIDFYETDAGPEYGLAYVQGRSLHWTALQAAVMACEPAMPWRDPDTGAEVGCIRPLSTPVWDGSLEASTPVALTCLQWTSDLLLLGIHLEVIST